MYKKKSTNKLSMRQQLIILALIIVLPASALMVAFFQSKHEVANTQYSLQNIVENDMQQRALAYEGLKELTQKSRLSLENSSTRTIQEEQALEKFDNAFFEEYYDMLDKNVDAEILIEFLFSRFDEADSQLANQILEQINEQGENVANTKSLTRGDVILNVEFMLSMGMLAGWFAGAIWRLTAVAATAGSTLGIIGTILGAAIGALITAIVQRVITGFLNKYGNNFKTTWFKQEVFRTWIVFVKVNYTLNIASMLASILA